MLRAPPAAGIFEEPVFGDPEGRQQRDHAFHARAAVASGHAARVTATIRPTAAGWLSPGPEGRL
ncbi:MULTISPECIES: hypothetical protein [Protofrankia]|uniref:Uncharacterized protein n=2 Tax=Protofrankia TaxID=2994361 RepID=F8AYS5_9ACTN|nr:MULTISPECIES: hypothetical protein [Protofrankia]AEH08582.1 hypothetical protein FsymDg_1080 [Candidatus Protofrankia datiscae]KLL12051.1 hypothetical protein FrCorBMG51_07255 [Protofrankia coriariae]ONH35340.1 hypothetical protein BL254_11735 [Protofrankia sp. BMG5.30]